MCSDHEQAVRRAACVGDPESVDVGMGVVPVRIFGREHPVLAKPGVRTDSGERRVAGDRQTDHREVPGDPVQRRDRVRPRLPPLPGGRQRANGVRVADVGPRPITVLLAQGRRAARNPLLLLIDVPVLRQPVPPRRERTDRRRESRQDLALDSAGSMSHHGPLAAEDALTKRSSKRAHRGCGRSWFPSLLADLVHWTSHGRRQATEKSKSPCP